MTGMEERDGSGWVRFILRLGAGPTGALITLALVTAVTGATWIPEWSHWYVPGVSLDPDHLDAARRSPEQSTLDEIAAMELRASGAYPDDVASAAELLTGGTLQLPGYPAASIALPFAADDLTTGSPTFQLQIASLVGADILLDAYRITANEEYFDRARAAIVELARYESSRWINHGFLWNDHAIAARIPVLVKFWAAYRERADYDPSVAGIVLNFVARSGRLLAKPSHYAWQTGHGTIQDLALLQVAAAFPGLPDAERFRSIAVERFHDHIDYYIGPEGVTLLHSAGYHRNGLYFLGMAMRLFTLNLIAVPPEWWGRYARAVRFHNLLRRPDGTLPMFGDTRSSGEGPGPPLTAPDASGAAKSLATRDDWFPELDFFLYPVAGHAVGWSELQLGSSTSLSQTVVTWSYHPGHGHKLADEPSVLIWAGGRSWLTNTGYWPYGQWGRQHAESWEGSNAPHLVGETPESERVSRVLGFAKSETLSAIDIERSGPSGYLVRRQIIVMPREGVWVALDSFHDGSPRMTTTTWTFHPDLALTRSRNSNIYLVRDKQTAQGLVVSTAGSDATEWRIQRGNASPFAGWVVIDRTPTPAPAIVVNQPSRNAWALATFSFSVAAADTGTHMSKWADDRNWTLTLPADNGPRTLTREGSRFSLTRGERGEPGTTELVPIDDRPDERAIVVDAFRRASRKYPQTRELIRYRTGVSFLLVLVLAVQETALLRLRRINPALATGTRVASWVCWILGGLWLSLVYFNVG
jgi:hypothetical protein